MNKAAQLLGVVLCVGTLSQVVSVSVCEDVFPHLSFGLGYSTEEKCVSGGGCWESAGCYFPKVSGYSFSATERSKGSVKGNLTLISPSGALGPDYKTLNLEIVQETISRTHVLIVPSTSDAVAPWQVPESIIKRPGGHFSGLKGSEIIVSPVDPFQFKIQAGDETIFTMSKMLIFQEQYVQVVLSSPANVKATYGFGESTRDKQALQKGKQYTLWNTDFWAGGFDASLYGTHPFFIQVTDTGKAHGVMFLNSNAMELTVDSDEEHGSVIGIQTTGGVVDFYVFSGPTPGDVIKQYLEVIGKPAMIPYWSLGFHNCRWGYKNLQHIKDVVANYSNAGIPLETQWADIDYMQNYKDFTTDAVNFPQGEFKSFVDRLHDNNQRFVPIIDPGIYVYSTEESPYSALTEGIEQNVFIKDLYGKEPFLGQVWPGATYFPDWFATNATDYWVNQLKGFHDLVPYDGIWIDMNEVSNFCNAYGNYQVCELDPDSTCPDGCCLKCATVDATNKYDFPPYTPHVSQGSLSGKTIAMSSLHEGNIPEYYTHPFYGLMESIATNKAVTAATNERAFVLSRSTYMSSGVYTAHWTGDNAARWADLAASIITMNSLSLFGIPMTGADICGFAENTTEELCSRWIEVGAFSPFSRNHNELDSAPQELFLWSSVTAASVNALSLRYQLLPYLYTLMYSASAFGNTVMNALWVNFPSDPIAGTIDGQYMWSNGILFTPVLTQGASSVNGYFPKGIWYPLFENTDTTGVIDASSGGKYVELPTPLTATNAHVQGGTIVPMQQSGMTTTEVKNSPYTLLVALNEQSTASGEMYLDNGTQVKLDNYTRMQYTATQDGTFTSKVLEQKGEFSLSSQSYAPTSATIKTIRVLGAHREKSGAQNETIVCKVTVTSSDNTANKVLTQLGAENVQYNAHRKSLDVDMSSLNLHVTAEFSLNYQCV